jgi:hypothetical protein
MHEAMHATSYLRRAGSFLAPNRRNRASHLIVAAALCWGQAACQATSAQGPVAPAVETDVQAVQSVVARVAHHIDGRRWQELLALFADEVETDYTSLFGGQIQRQRADQLVLGGWKKLLSPLEATQHLLGPIDVRVQGGVAIAECHVRGYHRSARARSGPEWMVAGHYIFELTKFGAEWKIRKLVIQSFYQTGNANLLQESAAGN